jgi:hypothetical protein
MFNITHLSLLLSLPLSLLLPLPLLLSLLLSLPLPLSLLLSLSLPLSLTPIPTSSYINTYINTYINININISNIIRYDDNDDILKFNNDDVFMDDQDPPASTYAYAYLDDDINIRYYIYRPHHISHMTYDIHPQLHV